MSSLIAYAALALLAIFAVCWLASLPGYVRDERRRRGQKPMIGGQREEDLKATAKIALRDDVQGREESVPMRDAA